MITEMVIRMAEMQKRIYGYYLEEVQLVILNEVKNLLKEIAIGGYDPKGPLRGSG